jgi:hypothetical protein
LKIAVITSTNYLEEFASKGTMDMALAPLCFTQDRSDFNTQYCDYFRERSKQGIFVLMDNGAYEKELLSNEMLLEVAHYIKPSCIVAPDELRNFNVTIEKTFAFLDSDSYKKLPKEVSIMAVPQGKTLSEYIDCYRMFAFDHRIDFIGLNFVSNFDLPDKQPANHKDFEQMNNRIALTKYLHHNNLINKDKKHHLLGLSSPLELAYQRKYDWIYSNDSSCAFIHGAIGVKVDKERGLIDTCTNKVVNKSFIDIKDFEYGYLDESKTRPDKPIIVDGYYKPQILQNIDSLLGIVQ